MEIELSSMLPTDWRDWEDSLDTIGSLGPFEMDLGLDTFLLATADDFAEPFVAAQQHATLASPPDSPTYAPTAHAVGTAALPATSIVQPLPLHHVPTPQQQQQQQFYFAQQSLGLRDEDEELLALADGELFLYDQYDQSGVVTEHVFKCESAADVANSNSTVAASKRKRPADVAATCVDHIKQEPMATLDKKFKTSSSTTANQQTAKLDEQAERMFRRRYDILHEILEAWNTGGIEDMEEIADSVYDDDVTLISPDYTDGLRGVHAIMSHWNDLLDAFPDGIMEEYEIQREDALGEKLKATWVFSGTQIFPIFGVEPRHEKVCISGTSFFSFNGDKIRQVVLSWNYREALMKLMGVQPAKGVVLSAHVPSNKSAAAKQALAAATATAAQR